MSLGWAECTTKLLRRFDPGRPPHIQHPLDYDKTIAGFLFRDSTSRLLPALPRESIPSRVRPYSSRSTLQPRNENRVYATLRPWPCWRDLMTRVLQTDTQSNDDYLWHFANGAVFAEVSLRCVSSADRRGSLHSSRGDFTIFWRHHILCGYAVHDSMGVLPWILIHGDLDS